MMSVKRPVKICIVGLKCYDLIARNPAPRYIGGIETVLIFLAKELAKQGCDTSLITYDHGQSNQEIFDGVKVVKSYNPDVGLRGIRWVMRAKRLWNTMWQVDADIYLQMGAGLETGLVAFGCRGGGGKPRKHFVFCLAHDSNFGAALRAGKFGWEGKLYRYGLHNADLIISQTVRQREGLRNVLGLNSEVVTIAAASPISNNGRTNSQKMPARVLWAGRIVREKRLEWLLELARQCPDIIFDVAGAPNTSSQYATDLLNKAGRLPNVKLHGRLGPSEMHKLYQSSHLLCNTSTSEGFPNTYVEAWSYGIPVVATFDPDDIVRQNGLGRISVDLDGLAKAVREMLEDQRRYCLCSESTKRYYRENHTAAVVARRLRSAFEELAISS